MLVARCANFDISKENSANSAVPVTTVTDNTAVPYKRLRRYGK
jgi:hypothetical protein